jgi:hypothetical protein
MQTKRQITIAQIILTLVLALFVLFVPFISLADSAVCVDLQTAIGSQAALNRTVVLTPIAAASSPNRISLLDRSSYDTGTNGYFWVSNVVEGIYQAEVKYPPSTAVFRFYVDGTNAVIYASSNQVAAATATIPSSTHAWSAFASDLRYALKGEAGTSTGSVDTNAVIDLIQAATFPLISITDRGNLGLWALRNPEELDSVVDDIAAVHARMDALETADVTNALQSQYSGYATNAGNATNAQFATTAGHATTATSATLATDAGHAETAGHATTSVTSSNLFGNSTGTHFGEVRPQSGSNIFQIRRSDNNAIVFWITPDGKLNGDGSALTGITGGGGTATNVTVSSITDANQLTNWAAIAPAAKVDTSAIGTAAHSNAAAFFLASDAGTAARSNATSFYPSTSNPSNYASIGPAPAGVLLQVTNGSGTAVFTVTSSNIVGELDRSNVVGQVAKDADQDGRLTVLEAGGGGGGTATNIFNYDVTVTVSNATSWTPIHTNLFDASTNYMHTSDLWVHGHGPTNFYFGELRSTFHLGPTYSFGYASNVFAATGTMAARVTTNAAAEVIWEVIGAANESTKWNLKGWEYYAANGAYSVAGGGGGGGGDNTLTNDLISLWSFEGEPWVDSIGTNTLTEAGTVTFPSGLVGLSAGFSSSPDALTTAASTNLTVTNGFSFALWTYLSATNANGPLLVKDTVTDGGRVIASYYSSAGQNFRIAICTNLTGATITYVTGVTNQHALDQPYFVAGVFNPTNKTVSLWVGTTNANSLVMEKEQVFDPWIKDSHTTPIRFGAWSTYLNGKIDEAGIWRRALSGADVTNVWTKALQGKRVNEP